MNPIALPERGYRRSRLMDSTGLVITVPGLNGEVFGPFDFSVAPPSGMVRTQVAAAFAECVAPDGVWHTRGSMRTAFNASLAFLRSLNSLDVQVESLKDFGPEHWWAWRADREAVNRWPGSVNLIRVLLRRVPDLPALTARAISQRTHKPRKRLYDSYSPSEFEAIRAAAARDVHAAETRIRRNTEALTIGPASKASHPAIEVNGVTRDVVSLLTELREKGRLACGNVETRAAIAQVLGTGELHPSYALFPSRLEVIAMMVLLVCERGFNLSTLESMTVPEVVGSDGDDGEVLASHTDKPRRGHRRYSTQSFSGSGARTMRRIVTATAPARETLASMGHPTDQLFVSVASTNQTRHPSGLFLLEEFTNGGPMRRWEHRHHLVDDNGQPLRVTFPRLRLSEQVLNHRASQNTDAVSEDVYRRPDPRTADMVADVVLEGQQHAVEHAEATVRMRYVEHAEALGLDAEVSDQLAQGRLDTATGACLDYTHSPHDPAGSPCTASFLLCLACPNAISTPAHLPRLVALREAFANYATANQARFTRQVLPHSERLEDLLATIHTTDLSNAKARITTADQDLVQALLHRELDA